MRISNKNQKHLTLRYIVRHLVDKFGFDYEELNTETNSYMSFRDVAIQEYFIHTPKSEQVVKEIVNGYRRKQQSSGVKPEEEKVIDYLEVMRIEIKVHVECYFQELIDRYQKASSLTNYTIGINGEFISSSKQNILRKKDNVFLRQLNCSGHIFTTRKLHPLSNQKFYHRCDNCLIQVAVLNHIQPLHLKGLYVVSESNHTVSGFVQSQDLLYLTPEENASVSFGHTQTLEDLRLILNLKLSTSSLYNHIFIPPNPLVWLSTQLPIYVPVAIKYDPHALLKSLNVQNNYLIFSFQPHQQIASEKEKETIQEPKTQENAIVPLLLEEDPLISQEKYELYDFDTFYSSSILEIFPCLDEESCTSSSSSYSIENCQSCRDEINQEKDNNNSFQFLCSPKTQRQLRKKHTLSSIGMYGYPEQYEQKKRKLVSSALSSPRCIFNDDETVSIEEFLV